MPKAKLKARTSSPASLANRTTLPMASFTTRPKTSAQQPEPLFSPHNKSRDLRPLLEWPLFLALARRHLPSAEEVCPGRFDLKQRLS